MQRTIDQGAYEILPNVMRERFDGDADNSMRLVAKCMAEDERQRDELGQRLALARLACLGGRVEIRRVGIISESKLFISDPLISDENLLYPISVTRQTFTLSMQAKLQGDVRQFDLAREEPVEKIMTDRVAPVAELKAVYNDNSTRLIYDEFAYIVSGSNDTHVINQALEVHDTRQ